jgi:hypothetical protein
MKDRLPTVNALITLHFPQPNDEPAKAVCITLAEAKDLHAKLGEIVAPQPPPPSVVLRSEPVTTAPLAPPYRIWCADGTSNVPIGEVRVTCGTEG